MESQNGTAEQKAFVDLAVASGWSAAIFIGLITAGLGVVVLVWPGETLAVLSVLFGIQLWLWFTQVRYPALGTPHFQVGRYMMALFFILLPVLIAFGDVEWIVHTVLTGSIVGKLRTVWYYLTTDKSALAEQAETK